MICRVSGPELLRSTDVLGGESFGVRPFFIVAIIVLGACPIVLFSVDERGHLGEKKSVADKMYMSGASLCVVSLSKTHLSLF